jgi:hypothetical protein
MCTKCSSNVIEDELHFLFECSKYDEDRESMLFEITTVCSNFRNLNSQNKLIWLFNSENIELLKTLCKFGDDGKRMFIAHTQIFNCMN